VSGLRGLLKPILERAGLLERARAFERAREERALLRRWPDAEFRVDVPAGRPLFFRTATAQEKRWFYPRYRQGEMHERPVSLAMLERVRPDSVCVDVGAFLGYYSALLAAQATKGTVVAVEMDATNREMLETNLERNAIGNVRVLPAAAFDSVTEVRYTRETFAASPGHRIGSTGGGAGLEEIRVPTVVLDDWLEREGLRPDLIKIDVEGAELGVLRGLARTLARDGVRLFVEVHPPELEAAGLSTDHVVHFLAERGYRTWVIEEHRRTDRDVPMLAIGPGHRFADNAMVYAERPA
jgi:FkbM family methyltransferase